MRKNVCYDINYDLPFDADMQIFTAQLYLMDKIDYKNKVNLILEDKTKFLNIPNVDQFSKTLSLQDKINKFVLKVLGAADCDGKS